jgi:uncharacterized membrane protein
VGGLGVRRRPDNLAGRRVAAALGALTVLAQIAYPLTGGETLRLLTIGTVLLFAAASLVHATATRGPVAGLVLLVVAGGIGLTAEATGVRTGVPFGEYSYTRSLGPRVLDVPLIVPLAWVMMAYPCLLLGRRLARWYAGGPGPPRARRGGRRSAAVVVLTGGLTLAAWDLFLDPQMVAAGHWTWAHPSPGLPGLPGIPLTNYAGWVVVALLLMAVLHLTFPEARRAPEGVPGALLAWTWAGSTVGNAVFFGRPSVAVWGGTVMGALVVPYLLCWWDGRP